jgi:hypothetical protein
MPPVEKGIDVKLAVDLIYAAMRKDAAALVLFSSDTDLLPAVELATEIGIRVEAACWDGTKRLSIQPLCTVLIPCVLANPSGTAGQEAPRGATASAMIVG